MTTWEQPLTFEDLGPNQHRPPPTNEPVLRGIVSGRPMFGSVDIWLQPGQSVMGDRGTLLWMDGAVGMDTELYGSCFDGIARECAGESCCMNRYKGETGGLVGFGFPLPGDLIPFACQPNGPGWVLSRGSFVAGTDNLKVNARFAGCFAMCFAGEGPFLTRVRCSKEATSPGMFYAGGFGAITRHDLMPGQQLLVDNGLFFAAHDKQSIDITIMGGVKSFCFSGEGFVMRFMGPCTIFTQNRDPKLFQPPEEQPTGAMGGYSD